MIHSVRVQNFKSLRDVTVELERLTVLVGPNASGKSSVLQALDFLSRAYRMDHPKNMEGEISQSLSRGGTGPIELVAEVDGRWYRYRLPNPDPSPGPPGVVKTVKDGRGMSDDPSTGWIGVPNRASALPASVLLRLETSRLVQPNPSSDPTMMSADGTGLHSALANIALSDPETWQVLQDNLRRIVPTVRRLRHTMKRGPTNTPALLFDMVGADSLPADQVSEGTLLVLGLLAALHSSGRPCLVLLDDLDRGLHPKAQRELIALLRGLLDTNPNLQIVATMHSPYMLDWVEASQVRMTFLRDDGSTACAPLTSHPKYPKWKDEMAPGEMWSLFGEKWVAEQGVSG